jgi:predicted GIY-YIG superfamily endonuclease
MSGVVYQLKVTIGSVTLFYIGSTTNLDARMSVHKVCTGGCSSSILYETGGEVICTILETVEFGSNKELLRIREQHWLDLCRSQSENCVNKNNAYISPAQKKHNHRILSLLRYQTNPVAAAHQKKHQRVKYEDGRLLRASKKIVNNCRRYPMFN